MTQIETILAEIERLKKELYKQRDFRIDRSPIPVYDTNAIDGMLKVLDEVKEFINSLPTEQNEDLEKAAKEYVKENAIIPEDCHDCEVPMYLMESATIFKDGALWQKEQTINKACKWLNKNVVEYHPRTGKLRPIVNINAFREAIED